MNILPRARAMPRKRGGRTAGDEAEGGVLADAVGEDGEGPLELHGVPDPQPVQVHAHRVLRPEGDGEPAVSRDGVRRGIVSPNL